MTENVDPRDHFISLIDLQLSRVLLTPHLTFVCGGPVDVRVMTNHSVRNMLMNSSASEPDKSKGFVLAENFKDWKDAYTSLSDFENDIAAISSLIVLILESAGSLTEFGLFFSNEALRKKMVVVVHSEHHEAESFIKFGLLNPMEEAKSDSVLVYDIDAQKIDDIKTSEVEEILGEIYELSESLDKSASLDISNRGHLIFLVYQVIDLFTIVTSGEVSSYMTALGLDLGRRKIESALYILQKFRLIQKKKRSSQTFYFSHPDVPDRVRFAFKKDIGDGGKEQRVDSRAVKVQTLEHYRKKSSLNASFNRRVNLWDKAVASKDE